MKYLLALSLALLALPAHATQGKDGFEQLKQCVMQNDIVLCHKVITPASYDIADRFITYKLMPCLPTNFTYESESQSDGFTVVRATMPAENNRQHYIRLAFTHDPEPKLDVPATLKIGMGPDWQNKIQIAENIYLMLRANAGNALTCDQLEGLIKKK